MVQPLRRSKEELVREFRTKEIISAARRVIVSEGLAAASLERIAEEAGVAKGTIYLYFESKDSLIMEVLQEVQEELLQEVSRVIESAESVHEQIRAIIRAHLDFARREKHLIRAALLEPGAPALGREGFPLEEYLNRRRRGEQLLARVIQRGIRQGDLKKVNAASAAVFFYELLRGLVTRVIFGSSPGESARLAQDMEKIFFHGVGK